MVTSKTRVYPTSRKYVSAPTVAYSSLTGMSEIPNRHPMMLLPFRLLGLELKKRL